MEVLIDRFGSITIRPTLEVRDMAAQQVHEEYDDLQEVGAGEAYIGKILKYVLGHDYDLNNFLPGSLVA